MFLTKNYLLVNAIVVRGGKFTWAGDEDQATWELKDINLEVGHGKLVAVVGSVGAGKSSLISALLGEMRKREGKVVVNVSVLIYICIYTDF